VVLVVEQVVLILVVLELQGKVIVVEQVLVQAAQEVAVQMIQEVMQQEVRWLLAAQEVMEQHLLFLV
jgi:hypothetical protein